MGRGEGGAVEGSCGGEACWELVGSCGIRAWGCVLRVGYPVIFNISSWIIALKLGNWDWFGLSSVFPGLFPVGLRVRSCYGSGVVILVRLHESLEFIDRLHFISTWNISNRDNSHVIKLPARTHSNVFMPNNTVEKRRFKWTYLQYCRDVDVQYTR